MKRKFTFLVFYILIATSSVLLSANFQTTNNNSKSHQQSMDSKIVSKKIGAKVFDYGSPLFNNPNYFYAAIKTAPTGVFYRQAGLSPDGHKIVAQKSYQDGGGNDRTEVILMNSDGTGETIISPGDSNPDDLVGGSDVEQYGNPFWSDDGTAIGWVESHIANPNKVTRYILSSATTSYIYEPTATNSVNNADFLGSSTTSIVFWDVDGGGFADLFIWNGTTLTDITNTPADKEYEPVSNAAGDKIVYWSGEIGAVPSDSTVHTLTYSGGSWIKDVGFTPIPHSYWPYWTNRTDNYIGVTLGISKDVMIYDNTGTLVTDLTGSGYSGGADQRNFFGTGFEGPQGEIILTSNAGQSPPTAARDIIIAVPIPATQAHDVTFSSVTTSSIHITWTNGNGSYRAVFMKATGSGSADPVNGTAYSASLTYSSGGSTPGGWYCVYNGSGAAPTITVTGLTAGTAYRVMVCEYNGNTSLPATLVYKTSAAANNPNNVTTNIPSAPTITAPNQYAVGVSVLPTITWNHDAEAIAYQFQVSLTSGGTPITLVPSYNGTSESYSFSYTTTDGIGSTVLTNGTTYYVRVKKQTLGGWSAWSTVQEFRTVNAAVPTITTLYPSGTSATIAWYPSPYTTGLTYDILLSTHSDMTSYTIPYSGTDNYTTLINLQPGTIYNLQVVAYTGSHNIYYSFSVENSFTTPGLPVPYASYPTTSVTNYFNPPTFYWYLGVYYPNLKFVVKYWRDGIDPSTITYTTPQTASSGFFYSNSINYAATLTATLTAGATYHWQVACTNDNGATYGTLSDIADFVVYSSVPATAPKPYLSWPVGGNTNYLNPPTFYWYTGTYATGLEFFVEWDDNSSFSNAHGNYGSSGGTWLTNLYYTLGSNLGAGTWYWRVTCRLTANHASFNTSDYDTFVIPATTSTVAVPYPTAPVGGLEVSSLNPTLSWWANTPPALTYRIRISPYSDVDGSGVLSHPTAKTSTNWVLSQSVSFSSFTFSGGFTLVAGSIYYWQVQATTDGGATVSSWSYVTSFSTAAGASLVVPFAVSPIKGQPINTTSAVLTWAAPAATNTHLKYDLEYSKSSNFTNSIKVTDINEPFVKIDGLDKNAQYYWRVVSKTSNNDVSSSSTVANFKTINGITDISNDQVIPSNYSLSQNYPNPFNPSTKISFALPKNINVVLKVYDMLGREVKTLINQEMNAGNYSTNWNGDNNLGSRVSSGIYIYRLTAGEYVATKKMVLIK